MHRLVPPLRALLRLTRALATLAATAALASLAVPVQAQTVRIAYIDPLSGPFANIGKNGLSQFQYAAERVNTTKAAGPFRLELMEIDNKGTPSAASMRSSERSTAACASSCRATGRAPAWRSWTRSASTTSATRARS